MQPKHQLRPSSFPVVTTGLPSASMGHSVPGEEHNGLVKLYRPAADSCRALRTTRFELFLLAFVDYVILLKEVGGRMWGGRDYFILGR